GAGGRSQRGLRRRDGGGSCAVRRDLRGKFPGEPAPSLQRTAAAPLDPGDVPPLLRSGAGRADGGGGRGEGGGLRVRAGLVAAAVAGRGLPALRPAVAGRVAPRAARSEEHTSELQSRENLV